MALPTPVVTAGEWQRARDALLAKEKELTRARDALAAERRRLPLVAVEQDYAFEGEDGSVSSLLELFAGRRQLIVYRFFMDPDMDSYPEGGCEGCSMFADNLADLSHLNARDTTLVFASAGEQEVLQRYRRRMGWDVPWYTTRDSFSADFDVPEYFGVNVFIREGESVYRSYFIDSRGCEEINNIWSLLDTTPLGRQESWQEAPDGVPQGPPYGWWARHDEYDEDELAGRAAPSAGGQGG